MLSLILSFLKYSKLQQADKLQRGYLDFDDFRRFVKLLKARPEIDRIHKMLCAGNQGRFDFAIFENFLKNEQKVTLVSSPLGLRADIDQVYLGYECSSSTLYQVFELRTNNQYCRYASSRFTAFSNDSRGIHIFPAVAR